MDQNGGHLVDDIYEAFFLDENVVTSSQFLLNSNSVGSPVYNDVRVGLFEPLSNSMVFMFAMCYLAKQIWTLAKQKL